MTLAERPSPERLQMALRMTVETARHYPSAEHRRITFESFHQELRRLSGDEKSSLVIDAEAGTITLTLYGESYVERL